MTGAFHEDGLADTADGLGAGGSPERINKIIHDSRLGTYGVVVFLGLLKPILLTLVECGYSLVILSGLLENWQSFFEKNNSRFAKMGRELFLATMIWALPTSVIFPAILIGGLLMAL